MPERLDEWPRVHSCLYDWCPEKSDECKRCDAIAELFLNSTPVIPSDDHAILPDRIEGGLEVKTSYERVKEADKPS